MDPFGSDSSSEEEEVEKVNQRMSDHQAQIAVTQGQATQALKLAREVADQVANLRDAAGGSCGAQSVAAPPPFAASPDSPAPGTLLAPFIPKGLQRPVLAQSGLPNSLQISREGRTTQRGA